MKAELEKTKEYPMQQDSEGFWWELPECVVVVHADYRDIAEGLGLVEEEELVHETPYGWWNQPIRYHVEHETIQVVDDTPLEEWTPTADQVRQYCRKNPKKVTIE